MSMHFKHYPQCNLSKEKPQTPDGKRTSCVNPQDFKKQKVSLLFQKLHMQSSRDIRCLEHLGRMPVLDIEYNCSAAERTA